MIDGIRFAITGYVGQEEDVLQMLNATRPTPRTREFLDWRYLGEGSEKAPRIFWLHAPDGRAIAMAALIFRPYWVRGERRMLAVLGDISVDPAWRGKKLSTQLIQAINTELTAESGSDGLVMANTVGDRSVASAKWETIAQLQLYVCLVNPARRLTKVGISPRVSNLPVRIYQRALGCRLHRLTRDDLSFQSVAEFDASFQSFWNDFPKQNLILRDRGLDTLKWRYRQPGLRCSIGKFFHRDRFIGYVVHQMPDTTGFCPVLDFLVAQPELARPCLALFLQHALRQPEIASVHLVLGGEATLAAHPEALGFFRRSAGGVLRSYPRRVTNWSTKAAWYVTSGDKDA